MAQKNSFLDPAVISAIRGMPLRAKTVVEGFLSGLHRSTFKGYSVEFAEYRQYMPGDDPKTIDWKLLARTDRYYVKEFEQETNLNCYIFLDTSGSMDYGSTGYTKLEYAATLAASLAHLAVRQRDMVGFAAFDTRLRAYMPAKSTWGHLNAMLTVLERLPARGPTDFQAPLDHLAEIIRRRGIVIVISDFLEDPEPILRAMRHLRFRRHDILVFQVLDPAELEFPFEYLSTFKDMETGEQVMMAPMEFRKKYLNRLNSFLKDLRTDLDKERIDYAMMSTATPLDHALFTFLAERKLRV